MDGSKILSKGKIIPLAISLATLNIVTKTISGRRKVWKSLEAEPTRLFEELFLIYLSSGKCKDMRALF